MRLGMLLLIAFLSMASIAYADTNINSCQTLSTANEKYTLTASMSSTGTCLTVDANGITIDCAGYTINYSNSATGRGVSITTRNSTVVKNCIIIQGSSAYSSSDG